MAEGKNKQLIVFQSESLRNFVGTINEAGIQKEDIVTIFQDNKTDEYVLLYYK